MDKVKLSRKTVGCAQLLVRIERAVADSMRMSQTVYIDSDIRARIVECWGR